MVLLTTTSSVGLNRSEAKARKCHGSVTDDKMENCNNIQETPDWPKKSRKLSEQKWSDPPTVSTSSSADYIYYNKQCTKAIRSLGLPRVWKNNSKEKPLKIIVKQEASVNMHVEFVRNDEVKKEHISFPVSTRPMLTCLHQDSPQLITEIRTNYLTPPDGLPLNLSQPIDDFINSCTILGDTLSLEVDEIIFKERVKNGFFVEAGGYNFEKGSTSLYFELKHGWTGVLIEPYSKLYSEGLTKHRNVTSINSCLSPEPHAASITYNVDHEGLILEGVEYPLSVAKFEVECFPLYSILLAMGNPTVNYFSLDIEGAEFQVLRTIPWAKVDIEVLSVETHFMGERSAGSKEDLIDFLDEKGYQHFPGAHKGFFAFTKPGEQETTQIENFLFARRDVACQVNKNYC